MKRMTAAEFRRSQLIDMSEADFSRDFAQLARKRGWKTYHTYNSQRSNVGFPDWILARDGRIVVAELKAVTGRWGTDQQAWLAALSGTPISEWQIFGTMVEPAPWLIVACWTPLDWDTITEVLK